MKSININKIRISIIIFFLLCSANLLGQSKSNTFLDYKLGTKKEEFLNSNLDIAKASSDHLWFSIISDRDMEFYRVENKKTSSGDKINITFGFYNDRLANIMVSYEDNFFLTGSSLLDALETKYGAYTDEKSHIVNNNMYIYQYYWGKAKNNLVIELYYSQELAIKIVTYADKSVQKELAKKKERENSKLIE